MSVFRLFKSSTPPKKEDEAQADQVEIARLKEEAAAEKVEDNVSLQSEISVPEKRHFFSRLKKGLQKTSGKFGSSFSNLLLGKKIIDEDLIDDVEMQLITADIGVDATEEIMEAIRSQVSRNELQTMEDLTKLLKTKLLEIVTPSSVPLQIQTEKKPYVILMVGINGAGKTTTIGKMAKKFLDEGHSVMLAAGDTFRAAAVEQLQEWGARNDVPVVAQHTGADSASVIFDGIQAAKSRGVDVLIADTAGRLHTKHNLMDELKKVVRVIKKLEQEAPHEVMLVLDAGTGQNALSQAEQFKAAVNVSGITLTKMDGTAKGGVIFAIAKKTELPVRYIGIGESIDDLRVFNASDFVDALFSEMP